MKRPLTAILVLALACTTAGALETQLTDAGADCRTPSWCASGYISFASNRSGSFDVWVMHEDGEDVDSWRATQTPANTDLEPAWNAGCTHLHFSGSTGGDYYLYYVRDSGFPPYLPILLSLEEGNNHSPHATADGVVFHADRAGNHDIMWKPTGSEHVSAHLTTDPADDRYPCLSPGDTLVAFASDRDGSWDIWLMHAEGEARGVWQLTDDAADETHPAFSPSGDQVVFHRDGAGLAVVDVRTRAVREVTSDPTDTEPCWSPDGAMIAFVRDTSGEEQIWNTDNVPETAVAPTTWGNLKALYR